MLRETRPPGIMALYSMRERAAVDAVDKGVVQSDVGGGAFDGKTRVLGAGHVSENVRSCDDWVG